MEEILKEIKNTKGVTGTFIINGKGLITGSIGEFGAIPLKSIANEIFNLSDELSAKGKPPLWSQFNYDNLVILVRAQLNLFIVCLCQPNAEMALVRLMLDIAFSRIKNDKKLLLNINKS